MAKYDDNDGVWRTIGGRRVFIRKGQSLASAMQESGKFKSPRTAYKRDKAKKENDEAFKNFSKLKPGDEGYINAKEEMLDKYRKFKEYDRANEEINKGKDFNKTARDYEEARQELKNRKEETSNTNDDWRTQIKSNKDKLEKDLQDFKEKNKNNMTDEKTQKEYYELFRKNERENAKLKREEPNEKYEYVEAYAGYKDKFNDTWGEDGSKEKVASAKMYTNDEFMEHLEDANWHRERQLLEDANLTNKELEYIKNRTNVSAWGVENLNGKEEVDALIKEAKENANKGLNLSQKQIDEGNRLAQKSEAFARQDLEFYFQKKKNYREEAESFITKLSNEYNIDKNKVKELYKEEDIKHRYDGTIKNLQQATNLSMEDIMEIVKEIEKKNKK